MVFESPLRQEKKPEMFTFTWGKGPLLSFILSIEGDWDVKRFEVEQALVWIKYVRGPPCYIWKFNLWDCDCCCVNWYRMFPFPPPYHWRSLRGRLLDLFTRHFSFVPRICAIPFLICHRLCYSYESAHLVCDIEMANNSCSQGKQFTSRTLICSSENLAGGPFSLLTMGSGCTALHQRAFVQYVPARPGC